MTEEHIKEKIALRYIQLIAAFCGYNVTVPDNDYGEDLYIIENSYNHLRKRYSGTGNLLKFQLKSTTENSISYEKNFIKYDLEKKNFNDLIERKDSNNPLILILFILPYNKIDWVNINNNELIVKKCAYWYYPSDNEIMTDNSYKKRIKIDKNNILNSRALNNLFKNY